MSDSVAPGEGLRVFGFGTEGGRSTRAARRRFDALVEEAEDEGVAWRDLLQDGYRAPGDLYAGGVSVRVDWKWRADELARRLRECARGTVTPAAPPHCGPAPRHRPRAGH